MHVWHYISLNLTRGHRSLSILLQLIVVKQNLKPFAKWSLKHGRHHVRLSIQHSIYTNFWWKLLKTLKGHELLNSCGVYIPVDTCLRQMLFKNTYKIWQMIDQSFNCKAKFDCLLCMERSIKRDISWTGNMHAAL